MRIVLFNAGFGCPFDSMDNRRVLTVQTIDSRRENVAALIPPKRKSELGQFMTPSRIAAFMASMFTDIKGRDVRLLDAGAGIGSLIAEFTQRAVNQPPLSVSLTAWEIDPVMREHLAETINGCLQMLHDAGIRTDAEIHPEDFILSASRYVGHMQPPCFTHAILNPPYKKLKSISEHRKVLRTVDIETSNVYTAFVALSLLMLEKGGELIAITPRSFCNGTYFKPFRRMLLRLAALRQVHVFEVRNHAFKGDDVLQENIIFHVVKGACQGNVILSTSSDATFSDAAKKTVPFGDIIQQGDDDLIIHLPTEAGAAELDGMTTRFPHSLAEIGMGVCTGPVVDFRMKTHLRESITNGCVPLIYCLHFTDGFVSHPKPGKKPNAIA